MHDCAMAHQRYIFQGSEGRYPLKEEVKVDDGLRKLAFLKPNIKLDNGSERDISLRSHFLIFFIAKAYDARSGTSLKDKGEGQPIPSLPKR